jgi:hypothetical protein
MIKRFFIILVLLFSTLVSVWVVNFVNADNEWPTVNCEWLPWCNWWAVDTWAQWEIAVESFLTNIVTKFIWYVAVVAVISIMFWGIMYMTSGWEEEKVNKAKKWIMWSLVWVLISVSAYGIINFVNSLKIGLGW